MSDITQGRLFYVIGPSGAGKDSFLCAARERWGDQLLVAHRYITRSAAAGGENHVALSDAEFSYRKALGLFVMHWCANGHRYGLGHELVEWLSAGADVMVNGSRAALAQAQKQFGSSLIPVALAVSPEQLAERLRARGRESEGEIVQRLERAVQQHKRLPAGTIELDNGGAMESTLTQFAQQYL